MGERESQSQFKEEALGVMVSNNNKTQRHKSCTHLMPHTTHTALAAENLSTQLAASSLVTCSCAFWLFQAATQIEREQQNLNGSGVQVK